MSAALTSVLRFVSPRFRWLVQRWLRHVVKGRESLRAATTVVRALLFVTALVGVIYAAAPWLPNPLGIRGEQATTQLLAAIIGALAAILGILLAVALVSYELSAHTYRTYALRLIFRNPRLAELLTLFVATILVSAGALATIDAPLSPKQVAGVDASLVLFLISLLALAPYCRGIIARSHAREDIRVLAASITQGEIGRLSHLRTPEAPSEQVRTIEESPVFILGEIGVRTLLDQDRLTPKLVVAEAAGRLLELLADADAGGVGGSRRTAIEGILGVVRPIAMTAIETRSEGALQTVIQFVERVHRFGAEHQFAWHEFIELDTFSSDVLRLAVDAGLIEAAQQGVYALERVAMAHLRSNVPPEAEIWLLHVRDANPSVEQNTDKDLQWDHMSTGYIGKIAAVGVEAARHGHAEVVRTVLLSFAMIEIELVALTLGDLQKDSILSFLSYEVKQIATTAARYHVDEALRLSIPPFGMTYLNHVFESGKPYSRAILMAAGETFIALAEAGALNTFALNDLVAFGRGSARRINQPLRREAVLYLVRVLSRLRGIVTSRSDKPSKQLYLETHDQMQSLQEFLTPEGKEDQELMALFQEELQRFENYDATKAELSGGVVPWPASGGRRGAAEDV